MRSLQEHHDLRTCCDVAGHIPIDSSEQVSPPTKLPMILTMLMDQQETGFEREEAVVSEEEDRHDPPSPLWAKSAEAEEEIEEDTEDTDQTGMSTDTYACQVRREDGRTNAATR